MVKNRKTRHVRRSIDIGFTIDQVRSVGYEDIPGFPPYTGITQEQVRTLSNIFCEHLEHCSFTEKQIRKLLKNVNEAHAFGDDCTKALKKRITKKIKKSA